MSDYSAKCGFIVVRLHTPTLPASLPTRKRNTHTITKLAPNMNAFILQSDKRKKRNRMQCVCVCVCFCFQLKPVPKKSEEKYVCVCVFAFFALKSMWHKYNLSNFVEMCCSLCPSLAPYDRGYYIYIGD